MTTRLSRSRPGAAFGAIAVATSVLSFATAASAFDAKHTPSGAPVRWESESVDFVLSPTLDDAADQASDAVSRALASWKGAGEAPALRVRRGDGTEQPGYDGKNVVLFAPKGFAPGGGALAVTLLTYEAQSGRIVDSDIVIDGRYRFALLDSAARPDDGQAPVSTEAGGSVKDERPFDLLHVLAHEAGHTLGLADEPHQESALMFPYTRPGDASVRGPQTDDLAGVATLYAMPASLAASDSSGGCAVAPASRAHALAPLAPVALALGLLAIPFARRRSRAARRALFATGAFCTLSALASGGRAQAFARPRAELPRAHAVAEVTALDVVLRDGLFTTDVSFVVRECRRAACPASAHATVWGGRAGGLTQEMNGMSIPEVGQRVALAFDAQNRTTLVREESP